jgi:hypothetical protein
MTYPAQETIDLIDLGRSNWLKALAEAVAERRTVFFDRTWQCAIPAAAASVDEHSFHEKAPLL